MAREVVLEEGLLKENFDLSNLIVLLEKPNKSEVKVIQQVIIAGLCENVSRIAPVLDSQGNEIVINSKTKVFYES
jgi:hypothetical protein